MEDNILNIKKEMIKKAKIKDLSRLEKYMSVQKEIQYLNFEERKLLIDCILQKGGAILKYSPTFSFISLLSYFFLFTGMRIIDRVVKTAALFTLHGHTHNQITYIDHITQLT